MTCRRPRRAGELAAAVGLTSAATTAMLDRLERKGLVRRVPDPGDRRSVLVEMTEGARRLAARFYGPLAAEGAEAAGKLGRRDLERIRDYFLAGADLMERHRRRIGDGEREGG